MSLKLLSPMSVLMLLALAFPAPVRAVDPVTAFLAEYLVGRLIDEAWDNVSDKPDVRLLDQRLKELEKSAVMQGEMRTELRKLRASVNDRMTREEFRREARKIVEELTAIKRRLDDLEERVEKLEVENEDLRKGTGNAARADYFRERGDKFAADKQYLRALANYNVALRLNPALGKAHIGRVRVYFDEEAWGVVVVAASEALNQRDILYPSFFYFERGAAHAHLGERKRALRDLSEAIKRGHTYAVVYCARATVHYEQNDFDRCIADCDSALKLDSKSVRAYFLRGSARFRKEETDEAITDLSRAIKLDPKYSWAHRNRGAAYLKKGDLAQALADLNESIRLNREDDLAFEQRSEVYQMKRDYDNAIKDRTEVIRLRPRDAMAYYNRGAVYLMKGDYDRTIADCTEAIRLNPRLASAYNNRGVAYEKKGDLKQAHADVDESRRLEGKKK